MTSPDKFDEIARETFPDMHWHEDLNRLATALRKLDAEARAEERANLQRELETTREDANDAWDLVDEAENIIGGHAPGCSDWLERAEKFLRGGR